MSNARKKVIIRQFDGSLAWGHLPFSGFVRGGVIEFLDASGKVIPLLVSKIKTVAYVKDFNLDDHSDPEQIGRRFFPARPRTEGLWLRLEFHDRDIFEGLASFDLGLLEGTAEDQGLFITPPDSKSNTQRLFVPRQALANLQVLGWIGNSAKLKQKPHASQDQGLLFQGE